MTTDTVSAEQTSGGRGAAQSVLKRVLPYVISVLAAFAVGAVIIILLGNDPVKALQSIFTTSFKSQFGFIETMHKWVPITLSALAFTIPLSTGKFNIGAEGQLLIGATAGVAVGIVGSDLPLPILLPAVLVAGVLGGAFWSGIAALLLVRFGVNEILSTVLLNFVSFQVVEYVATSIWPDVGAGHPATISVGEGALLPRIGSGFAMHTGVLLTLFVSIVIAIAMRSTATGFEMRAVGSNPRASMVHGLKTSRLAGAGILIGGSIAGLAGAIEVAGVHGKMLEGMQSNFLILGIIVGLLARGNNFAVPFVAFGIAVLEVGASSMQRTAQVPVDLVLIIEALILLFVLLSEVPKERYKLIVRR